MADSTVRKYHTIERTLAVPSQFNYSSVAMLQNVMTLILVGISPSRKTLEDVPTVVFWTQEDHGWSMGYLYVQS